MAALLPRFLRVKGGLFLAVVAVLNFQILLPLRLPVQHAGNGNLRVGVKVEGFKGFKGFLGFLRVFKGFKGF